MLQNGCPKPSEMKSKTQQKLMSRNDAKMDTLKGPPGEKPAKNPPGRAARGGKGGVCNSYSVILITGRSAGDSTRPDPRGVGGFFTLFSMIFNVFLTTIFNSCSNNSAWGLGAGGQCGGGKKQRLEDLATWRGPGVGRVLPSDSPGRPLKQDPQLRCREKTPI